MCDQRQSVCDGLVFVLLIAIGVAGRWGQPEWCFTPTAAASLFAGWYFSRLWVAALVPIGILAASDLLLPAHDNLPVMIATYAVMTVPSFLGRSLRNVNGTVSAIQRWSVCGLAPATLFYIVTNFAVWAFQSNYEKNLGGLMKCYWAAVPFFRWMLAGDVFYLALLVACAALAGMRFARRVPAEAGVRSLR